MSSLSQFYNALKPPIANGIQGRENISQTSRVYTLCSQYSSASTSSSTYSDVVNYSGSGFVQMVHCIASATGTSDLEIIIDGVTADSQTISANNGYTPVGSMSVDEISAGQYVALHAVGMVPFNTSLQIRHKSAAGTNTTYYAYIKTR